MKKEPYKKGNAVAINKYAAEERNSRCGYSNLHWSQSGVRASTEYGVTPFFKHTRQNTVRSGTEEVLTKSQCIQMRIEYVPELQKTDALEKLYSIEEDTL